jgi:hypothetical protein
MILTCSAHHGSSVSYKIRDGQGGTGPGFPTSSSNFPSLFIILPALHTDVRVSPTHELCNSRGLSLTRHWSGYRVEKIINQISQYDRWQMGSYDDAYVCRRLCVVFRIVRTTDYVNLVPISEDRRCLLVEVD